jgi:hypothetical protein
VPPRQKLLAQGIEFAQERTRNQRKVRTVKRCADASENFGRSAMTHSDGADLYSPSTVGALHYEGHQGYRQCDVGGGIEGADFENQIGDEFLREKRQQKSQNNSDTRKGQDLPQQRRGNMFSLSAECKADFEIALVRPLLVRNVVSSKAVEIDVVIEPHSPSTA